jgi:hypothetical protein
MSLIFLVLYGVVGLVLAILPSFIMKGVFPVITVLQFSLQHFKLANAGDISEQISFIVATLMYKIADPFPSLTSSWMTLFCWQIFAMFLGTNIYMSQLDSDDLYLQCLFAGVVLGGLIFNPNLDWQILLSLISPTIELVLDKKGKSNTKKMKEMKKEDIETEEAFRVPRGVKIGGVVAAIGFTLSLLPKPLNEMDYFIVYVFMGYTGINLWQLLTKTPKETNED